MTTQEQLAAFAEEPRHIAEFVRRCWVPPTRWQRFKAWLRRALLRGKP